MATINRPTFQAIRSYLPTEPTIVFASFRHQTRLPAWNLITLDTYEEYSAGAVCDPGDVKYLNKLKRYIISNCEESDNNELYKYVQFVKSSVEAKRCESNLLCLHDLLNAAPELLASSFLYLLEPLNTSLKDVAEIMRIQVAQVVGILWTYGFDDRKFDAYVKECLEALSQRSLEHKHGWLLVLGHTLSKKMGYLIIQRQTKNFAEWQNFVDAVKVMDAVDQMLGTNAYNPTNYYNFIDSGIKRKGGQIRFSLEQTKQLEYFFANAKYLTPEERRHLAMQLKMSDRQVKKTWFQNRRAKWRRFNQSVPYHPMN